MIAEEGRFKMSVLSGFFKESHRSMGVFYPLHCLVAAFVDLKAAERVNNDLRSAGFAEDEVIAVDGKEFVQLEEEEAGIVSVLMQHISRGLGTEQVSTDHNTDFAMEGAGLLIVQCASDAQKQRAWDIIQPRSPLAAHYYARFSVEHLECHFGTR
jgi:hypothetical protein